MFEKATRMKLRFASPAGNLSVEDLWDMPTVSRGLSLNELAKHVNRELKDSQEEDFVSEASSDSKVLELKLDILKHVIKVKLGEKKAREELKDRCQKKEQILSVLAAKENEELAGKSAYELRAMVEGL